MENNMARIFFEKFITTFEGEPLQIAKMKMNEANNAEIFDKLIPVTVATICTEALNNPAQQPKPTIDDIMLRGKLIDRIRNNPDADFSLEELAFIKRAVQESNYKPNIIFQTVQTLEGATVTEAE